MNNFTIFLQLSETQITKWVSWGASHSRQDKTIRSLPFPKYLEQRDREKKQVKN